MEFLLVLLHRKLAGEQLCSAHSGLIVHPDYRNLGLAKKIKAKVFDYSLKNILMLRFWNHNWLAVMKINSELGYKPVLFRINN
jgi:GNAT superfamily N-acetyltransferase